LSALRGAKATEWTTTSDSSPSLLQASKEGFDLGVVGNVTRQDQLRPEALCQRPNAALDAIADVGEGELGALTMESLSNLPGDAVIVGDADDEGVLAR
jgi:hypothetical protein